VIYKEIHEKNGKQTDYSNMSTKLLTVLGKKTELLSKKKVR